jgi:hypothetical protein
MPTREPWAAAAANVHGKAPVGRDVPKLREIPKQNQDKL